MYNLERKGFSEPSPTWWGSASYGEDVYPATSVSSKFDGQQIKLADLRSQVDAVYENSLEPQFGSEEAQQISLAAYSNAIKFVSCIKANIPFPIVYADNDGLFDFEWYHEGRVFSVYVGPDDYVLWAKFIDDDNRGSGRFTMENELAQEYLEIIRKMYA